MGKSGDRTLHLDLNPRQVFQVQYINVTKTFATIATAKDDAFTTDQIGAMVAAIEWGLSLDSQFAPFEV